MGDGELLKQFQKYVGCDVKITDCVGTRMVELASEPALTIAEMAEDNRGQFIINNDEVDLLCAEPGTLLIHAQAEEDSPLGTITGFTLKP